MLRTSVTLQQMLCSNAVKHEFTKFLTRCATLETACLMVCHLAQPLAVLLQWHYCNGHEMLM